MNDPVIIKDNATPYLIYMMAAAPANFRKAMKSLGWYMQKEIKAGIRSKNPGGEHWADFIDPRIRAQLEGKTKRNMVRILKKDENWKRKYAQDESGKSVTYKPYGKLQRAIGYAYSREEGKLEVGYLSKSALRLGTMMENGVSKPVTAGVRKMYFAHAVPIGPHKEIIKIPPRPLMQPMRKILMPQMVPYLEKKLIEYWLKGTDFVSSSRKYKVWR